MKVTKTSSFGYPTLNLELFASTFFPPPNRARNPSNSIFRFARLLLTAMLAATAALLFPAHAVPQEHQQPVHAPFPHPSTSVAKVNPTFGAVGTSVVITGGGGIGTSGLSGATAVYFGGVSATFTANADGTLTATAPPVPIGVSVAVTAMAAGAVLPSTATFTYQVGQLIVSGPLPYSVNVEGDVPWANPSRYNAYSLYFNNLPTNGGVYNLVFPSLSPALHLATLFNDTQQQWPYNYNAPPPVVPCPWSSAQSPQPCFSAGNVGTYSAAVSFCNVSSQPPPGSPQTPNCTNWDGNKGWWLPTLVCPSSSAPCANSASQSLNTSGPGQGTVGDLAIPLDALFGPVSLARTLMLTSAIGEGSTAPVPSFPLRGANISSTAFNVVVTPVAMVQTSVIPYTLVYAPPGNQSTVTFMTSATYGTQYNVENDQEIDNQITTEQSSSTAFSLKAAAYYLTGSVDVTSGWDDSVLQGFSQVNSLATQQQNSLAISVSYPIPANPVLVPGSGVVCASQTDCSTTTTISNPYQLEPFWGDTFVLNVHPEYATYVFGNAQTRFALFGAVPVTVDATVQQLDDCRRGYWAFGQNQCIFEYSDLGVTVVSTGQPPVYMGQTNLLTLAATDAANLLALDPFYGKGQGANLDTNRAIRIPSVGSPAYGAKIGQPPRPYGPTAINNTQAAQVTGKAQQSYFTTITSVESQSDAFGIGFSANSGGGGASSGGSGDSSGQGGDNSGSGPPASLTETLTYTVGSKQTDQYTLKNTFLDSTATSTQTVTLATVTLNDVDNTSLGSGGQASCTKCHNPLPYQPTVNIYLDRLFGSYMFQDPAAPGPPTLYRPASEAVSDLNLILILTGQESARNRFTDVPKADAARGMIGFLAREQIMPGTSKGLFSPNAPITRGQLAETLASALQLKTAVSPTSAYKDVPAGTLIAARITAAVNAGLVSPSSASTFRPNDPTSRQDLATALSSGFALTATQAPAVSDATKISPAASASVAAVVSKGYLKAFPDKTFRPTTTVTREEAAQAIYMALYDQMLAAAQKAQ